MAKFENESKTVPMHAPEPEARPAPRGASNALRTAAQIERLLEPFSGPDIARILAWVSGSFQERMYPPGYGRIGEGPAQMADAWKPLPEAK